jgi:uncharacterized protein with GYD domain
MLLAGQITFLRGRTPCISALTGQYTPQALNGMMDNPSTNRSEVAKKVIEAAGGKMICFFSVPADGPGVLLVFDVPEPDSAAAISGIVVATNTLHNVQLKRLLTQAEVVQVRQKAAKLRTAYTPPSK